MPKMIVLRIAKVVQNGMKFVLLDNFALQQTSDRIYKCIQDETVENKLRLMTYDCYV